MRDSNGHRVGLVNALSLRTTTGYDANGLLTLVQNPAGQRVTGITGATGQRLADVNGLGQRASYAYNAYGQSAADAESAREDHDVSARRRQPPAGDDRSLAARHEPRLRFERAQGVHEGPGRSGDDGALRQLQPLPGDN